MTQDCAESIFQREEAPEEEGEKAEAAGEKAEEEVSAPAGEGVLERLLKATGLGQEGEVLFLLGELHAHGLPKNEKKAIRYYAEAITKKHAEAFFKLGLLYESGSGVPQSDTLALRRFKKAAEMGHAEAQFRLGKMYVEGRGQTVVEHKPRGCELLRQAAQNGHAEAARLYAQVTKEILKKHFSSAVTPEDEKLWLDLGEASKKKKEEWFAEWGWHAPADPKNLKKWYATVVQRLTQKAGAGNANAQWRLAEMYREGFGVVRDYPTAHLWYQKAADSYLHNLQLRDVEVNYRLGEMFLKGRGVEKNRLEAMEWFKKAAGQGHAQAQYYVGKIYAGGQLGAGKIAQAIKWYTKAAQQGHPKALFYLKKLSLTGQGAAKRAKAALAEVAQAKALRAKTAAAKET